jgi:hypothetical protein
MVKHIVCWKLKDSAEGLSKMENAQIMKDMLLALKNKLNMTRTLEIGINAANADRKNYDISMTVLFETFHDLETYQNHPEHIKVGEFVGKIRESRVCIDYEVD